MTGSWDNTVKFWDTRQSNPMMVLQIPERVYCADVVYPMAIVGTAQRGIICYQLENQPSEVKRLESPLKYQVRTEISVIWKMKKSNTRTLRKILSSSWESKLTTELPNHWTPRGSMSKESRVKV